MKKSAVLVGINVYRDYPQDELRGCVDDCNNLWMLLVNKLGFDKANVLQLKDLAATAAAEKEAVLNMVTSAGPNDKLVWSHSSHGTNNPDPTQKDGMEELLCCTEVQEANGLWKLDTVISAKWIGETIAKLHPQATLDIVIDACHSPEGGQLKALGRSYSRARFLPRSVVGIPVKPLAVKVKEGGVPPNVCLWAACQPDQTSADAYINDTWQGAFTAAFLYAWKAGRTRVDMIAGARNWLKNNRYEQIPHLYGGGSIVQQPFAF